MALSYQLDDTDASSIQEEQDEETGAIRRVALRSGLVWGIDEIPKYALWNALNNAGLPRCGVAFEPDPTMVLRNRLIRAAQEADDAATIQLRYVSPTVESPSGGSEYLLRDSSVLVSEMSEFDPPSGQQMLVKWQDPTSTNSSTIVAKFRRLRPSRTIIATGSILAPVSPDVYQIRGRVNEFAWLGEAPGTWIVWGADMEAPSASSSRVKLEVTLAHNPWGWSAYATYHQKNGLLIPLRETDMKAAVSQPYNPGQLYQRNGITRLDYPDWFDFEGVLGLPG